MKATPTAKACTAVVAAVAATLAFATPASAISRVTPQSTCDGRSDFWAMWNSSKLCFANAGTMSIAVYGVNLSRSGHNSGYLGYNQQGQGYVTYFGYDAQKGFLGAIITQITIY
jgi:hypothetical protein